MVEYSRSFPSGERLQKRRDFLEIYRSGDKIRSSSFYLYLRPNQLTSSRLGLTASRKIGKPIIRNRLKRRLREIFRAHKGMLQPPVDVVVNVRRTAAEASYAQLEKEFVENVESWKKKFRSNFFSDSDSN